MSASTLVGCVRCLLILMGLVVSACNVAVAGTISEKHGRVMFWYDTEDYVSPDAPDAALFHAGLLKEFGFRGNFAVVGFYAQRLVECGRYDVIAALRQHCIGSQTLYHSRHPTVCEYTDVVDWKEAYGRCLAEESECLGMLKAVFGLDKVDFFVPPGTSVTPVPMFVYADRGVRIYGGGVDFFGKTKFDRLVWYCNMLHIPYVYEAGPAGAGVPRDLGELASRSLSVIYTHPCELYVKQFWDVVNYQGQNACEWRQWKLPKTFSSAKREEHRQGWRNLMSRIKNDKRLSVVDCDDLMREIRPRKAIVCTDVPLLLSAMERELAPVEAPASWSVSDIFQATHAFLCGKSSFMPEKAWGFLEEPVGVASPIELSRADIVAAARLLNVDGFLPSQIVVGRTRVGPADFLIAALKVLSSNAETVTVGPRDQLGPIGKHLPNLPNLRLTSDVWCIYPESLKDEYLTDRLRWQFWTLRYEGD